MSIENLPEGEEYLPHPATLPHARTETSPQCMQGEHDSCAHRAYDPFREEAIWCDCSCHGTSTSIQTRRCARVGCDLPIWWTGIKWMHLDQDHNPAVFVHTDHVAHPPLHFTVNPDGTSTASTPDDEPATEHGAGFRVMMDALRNGVPPDTEEDANDIMRTVTTDLHIPPVYGDLVNALRNPAAGRTPAPDEQEKPMTEPLRAAANLETSRNAPAEVVDMALAALRRAIEHSPVAVDMFAPYAEAAHNAANIDPDSLDDWISTLSVAEGRFVIGELVNVAGELRRRADVADRLAETVRSKFVDIGEIPLPVDERPRVASGLADPLPAARSAGRPIADRPQA